jgi:hypothetical protein
MTSSPTTLVGAPWEILRTTNLTPAHPHTIDIYGKSGGLVGYMAQIALIDQYGVGIIVLTAGPVDSMNTLYRTITGTIMPAIEQETRDQSTKYTGKWTSTKTNTTQPNTSPTTLLNITLDNGPGLKLSSLTHKNTSILASIQTIFEAAYTSTGFGILSPDFRIYPTELEAPISRPEAISLLSQAGLPSDQDVDLVRQDWRVNIDIVPMDGSAMSDLPGQQSLNAFCASWQLVDWMRYGGEALDRIVFVVEKNSGMVVGAEVPVLREGLLIKFF